jgi:hypothetical protein
VTPVTSGLRRSAYVGRVQELGRNAVKITNREVLYMIRKLTALPCLLALVLACGQGRTDGQDTGAVGGAESGALPADTGYPGAGIDDTTAAPSVDAGDTAPSDTAAPTSDTGAPSSDTAASTGDSANQTESGVTDAQSGESELGGDVTKTTPDQGEPVTSKGDTVGTSGADATSDTAQP